MSGAYCTPSHKSVQVFDGEGMRAPGPASACQSEIAPSDGLLNAFDAVVAAIGGSLSGRQKGPVHGPFQSHPCTREGQSRVSEPIDGDLGPPALAIASSAMPSLAALNWRRARDTTSSPVPSPASFAKGSPGSGGGAVIVGLSQKLCRPTAFPFVPLTTPRVRKSGKRAVCLRLLGPWMNGSEGACRTN